MFYLSTTNKSTTSASSVRVRVSGQTHVAVNQATQVTVLTTSADGNGGSTAAASVAVSFPLNARIAYMARVAVDVLNDAVFVATAKHQWSLLAFRDPRSLADPVTLASGSFAHPLASHAANGLIASSVSVAQGASTCLAIHSHQGLLHMFRIQAHALVATERDTKGKRPASSTSSATTSASKKLKKSLSAALADAVSVNDPVTLRVKELQILDLVFLADPVTESTERKHPLLAILNEDPNKARFLTVYQIDIANESIMPVSPSSEDKGWSRPIAVKDSACKLHPVSDSAVLVFSDDGHISLYDLGVCVFDLQVPTRFSGVCDAIPLLHDEVDPRIMAVDEEDEDMGVPTRTSTRFLLGDVEGGLHLLGLDSDGSLVKMGETSQPSSLTFLDAATVYVGSHYGDSHLLRLNFNSQNYTVLDTYSNLAPIVDFVHIEGSGAAAAGQSKVVACCGAGKDGSLRVLRNGVGVLEAASVEGIEGVQGMWSSAAELGAGSDELLVVSFIGETKILAVDADGDIGEWEEDEHDVELEASTIGFGNVLFGQLVQVTPTQVLLLSVGSKKRMDDWHPSEGTRILKCALSTSRVVLALRGNQIIHLEVEAGALVEKGRGVTEHEVTCLDVHDEGSFLVAGMWTDGTVRVFSVETMEEIRAETLGGDLLPRSVKIATLGETPYLLVGLGDGQLIAFVFDAQTGACMDRRKLTLGTQPLNLVSFQSEGREFVFAGSDLPAVLYAGNNDKLMCSNLNLQSVAAVCSFRLPTCRNSLAIATATSLKIASLDSIHKAHHKLHVQKFPLGESPRRIVHVDVAGTIAVLTGKINDRGTESSFVRIFDDTTFDCVDCYQFPESEVAVSVCKVRFGQNGEYPGVQTQQCLVVGTAVLDDPEVDPKKGRIVVFEIDASSKKLSLLCSVAMKGCTYSIAELDAGVFVAAVGGKVQVVKIIQNSETKTYDLVPVCARHGFTQLIYVSVQMGSLKIAVGDLMRSVALLEYTPPDAESDRPASLEIVARDYVPAYTTCVAPAAATDSEFLVSGEAGGNLYTVRRQVEAQLEDERMRLDLVGAIHVGEIVNAIKPGSLAMHSGQEGAANPLRSGSLLFCTVGGTLGTLVPLDAARFRVLNGLQANLAAHLIAVGELSHSEWRTYVSDKRTQEATGFIDGDFVQQFAALGKEGMKAVFEGTQNGRVAVEAEGVNSVLSLLEELALVS
ncbi:CPSF A subunit region-domain-containing protein [Chytriomyces sp. MP71]|nr:CPSF A subunit region-domain-containing protein [Chytriomyces sp. MP71]